jgi:hypothetical protein
MSSLHKRTTARNSLPLFAELSGSNTCRAVGITVRANAPTLTMCRELLAAGLDPDQAMEVYRGATPALRIRSIGEGAKLTVKESTSDGRPRFVPYRPPAAARGGGTPGPAPPIAANEPTGTHHPRRHGHAHPSEAV